MYAGTDKYGGGVVGEDFKDAEAAAPNLEDILDTASAEETVVTSMPYSYLDEDTNEVVEGVSSVVLSSRLNPESGGLMWVEEEDSAETYKNVVSMSQMTSMLRDLDRNAAYEHGIRRGIEKFIATHHRRPIVLDIGTGTGLLAMLAARHGAEHVYACEMFQTMADIAGAVIDANGLCDKVTVFSLRSTQLTVPEHLPVRADMMVSELFDSLLLGEGLLPTLAHARAHLLTPDAVVVPQHATVFAKLVASDTLYRMNSFDQTHIDSLALARSKDAWKCTGGARVALPLHINTIPDVVDLTEVVPVLSFDFGTTRCSNKKATTVVTALASGRADAIVMWWSVDFGDGVTYCTASSGAQNWQDHWVPVVFPLTTQHVVAHADAVELTAYSDSLRIWFKVAHPPQAATIKRAKVDEKDDDIAAACICGLHLICNAERVSMLTNTPRTDAYAAALRDIVAGRVAHPTSEQDRSSLSVLDISDGSFGALLAASIDQVANITSIESKQVSALIFEQIASHHALDDRLTILGCGVKGLLVEHLHGQVPVDILVGEPFYYAMQNLPIWQALNFWYRRSAVADLLSARAVVLPYRASIRAMGVQFDHLHECFGTVNSVSGFNHAPFDALQGGYLDRDFPFPTYMYPYTAGTAAFEVMPLSFMEPVAPYDAAINVPITGPVNAVILWVEYQLDAAGHHHVATGPSVVHAKQAVRFLPRGNASTVVEGFKDGALQLTTAVDFQAAEGVLSYAFHVAKSSAF
ncbi:hypothetical protein H257_08080 [Aphanomyces astaci]|uniref:Protein arginine N-methyltransferase n=1 Tax=Aphanomyces astaci TaxID=112090 RepID=W4GG01_APHAT|nr:hypothetical protein H257_08080 [Aphanomyces astaci]ETV78580.1 hypothetical protein H257_08080 [Aphanomyces astaci]|eukprot:XP_009832161.1 hypothetical protein H257_08080 [Aphanomyces astaci]